MQRIMSFRTWIRLGLFTTQVAGLAKQSDHYQIHRLEKEYHALRQRDETCASGYSLCDANSGGGCCPSDYACASTYCYATTAGPTTACGKSGYFACPPDMPGRCCPVGNICLESNSCGPTVAVTTTTTCGVGSYLCPASLSGGCCRNGLGCAVDSCYSTEASTYTVTGASTTTNSAGSLVTSSFTRTTVQTPTATLTKTNGDIVAGLVQSTVSKVAAIETSASGGGLNHAQVGGVIGGVLAVLLAIIIATFLVMRRLRKNAKLLEESKQGSAAEDKTTVSYKPGGGGAVTTTVTEIDAQDVDPLTLLDPRTNRLRHPRTRSDSSIDGRHLSPARSPGLSSGQSTPPAWPGQYKPVPGLEHARHGSADSIPGGYDPSRQSENSRSSINRTSYDSQISHPYSRHWSYASEKDGQPVSELDASDVAAARRRSSSGASKPAAAHVRRPSDPHQRGRSDSSVPVVAPLGTLSEINELHGYYGPPDRQMGQTAARLQPGESPTTPEK